MIVTEQNPRGMPRSPQARPFQLRRSLIDCSPWQDRRPHRLGLTRPTPPRHRRKEALLNGDAGGPLSAPQAQLQVYCPYGHRGEFVLRVSAIPYP